MINRIVLSCLLAMVVLPAANTYAMSNCYLHVPNEIAATSAQKRALVESYGGRVIHEFPPSDFLCSMEAEQFDYFVHSTAASGAHDGVACPDCLGGFDTTLAYWCWSYMSWYQTEPSVPEVNLLAAGGDCGITPPGDKVLNQADEIPTIPRTVSRIDMFNANYLIGRTAVCIILPESVGETENWTPAEEVTAISRIVYGYDRLASDGASHNVDVNWVYEVHRGVAVNEEPIQHKRPSYDVLGGWVFGWMGDALNAIGASGSEWNQVFNNANRLRLQFHADWGLTYFMVKNATAAVFDGNALGYTQPYWMEGTVYTFRCPFAVSVYLWDGSPAGSDKTVAHETLHIFGAADEYQWAQDCGSQLIGIPLPPRDCNHGHGFLCENNLNCAMCTENQAECIMRGSWMGYEYCYHTLRQIGWTDTEDGDGHPDAIDQNNSLWMRFNAQPGDMVRIFTLDGDLLRNIAVTENKCDSGDIFYDCLNYQSAELGYQLYYYIVNDGEVQQFVPSVENPSIIPGFRSISYSPGDGYLRWEQTNSVGYVDLEIWGWDPVSGQMHKIAQPFWNKYMRGSLSGAAKAIYVDNILCDSCVAKFQAWRPDGVNSSVIEYAYSTLALLAPEYIDADMHWDQFKQEVQVSFSDPNRKETGYIIERKPASTGEWEVVDTLPAQNEGTVIYGDTTYTGSMDYTYRVKASSAAHPDAPYSDEVTVRTQPRWPSNFKAYVHYQMGDCVAGGGKLLTGGRDPEPIDPPLDSCPTNEIRIEWGEPVNQAVPIAEYLVTRKKSYYEITEYPVDTLGLTICPNSFNTGYTIGIKAYDVLGDSSKAQQVGVTTGPINACVGGITKQEADVDAPVGLPSKPYLSEGYPNPFNPSTVVELSLPEGGKVLAEVYNSLGQRVRTIVNDRLEAGKHQLVWDGTDESGRNERVSIFV